MNHFGDVENLILPSNSCPIEINKGVRGGIRIRLDQYGFDIEVRHANSDVNYRSCNKQHLIEHFKPHIGVVAANKDSVINEIDLDAIYVKNMDPRAY